MNLFYDVYFGLFVYVGVIDCDFVCVVDVGWIVCCLIYYFYYCVIWCLFKLDDVDMFLRFLKMVVYFGMEFFEFLCNGKCVLFVCVLVISDFVYVFDIVF